MNYQKIGVDIGNHSTKDSTGYIFPSKISKTGNILKNTVLTVEDGKYYIGEGSYDTEYRKIKKVSLKPLFLHSLFNKEETNFRAVVGLPIIQFQEDKDTLAKMLSGTHFVNENGIEKRINTEVQAYPEALAAIVGTEFQGILLDIGGRSTDVCFCVERDGIKQYENPFSLATGTLNLYSDFIKKINARGGFELKAEDAPRILNHGLKCYGQDYDFSFAMDVFVSYVEELVRKLRVDFNLINENVLLIGGGCELLYTPLKRRIPQAQKVTDMVFANANGYMRVGEKIWQ